MRHLVIITLCLLVAAPVAGQNIRVQSSDSTSGATFITHPYTYSCARGGFKTKLPAGCGAVRENWSEPHPEADPVTAVELIHVFCDQEHTRETGLVRGDHEFNGEEILEFIAIHRGDRFTAFFFGKFAEPLYKDFCKPSK